MKSTVRCFQIVTTVIALAAASSASGQVSTQGTGSPDYGDNGCPVLGCEMDQESQSKPVVHWFEHGLPGAEHCQGQPSGHGTCHSSTADGACWTHPSCLAGFAAMTEAVKAAASTA